MLDIAQGTVFLACCFFFTQLSSYQAPLKGLFSEGSPATNNSWAFMWPLLLLLVMFRHMDLWTKLEIFCFVLFCFVPLVLWAIPGSAQGIFLTLHSRLHLVELRNHMEGWDWTWTGLFKASAVFAVLWLQCKRFNFFQTWGRERILNSYLTVTAKNLLTHGLHFFDEKSWLASELLAWKRQVTIMKISGHYRFKYIASIPLLVIKKFQFI